VVAPALFEDALGIAPSPSGARDVAAGPEWPVSGVIRMTVAEARDLTRVASALHQRLRRPITLPTGSEVSAHLGRLVLRMRQDSDVADAERTIRLSVFKTTDDKPARFNRRMSLPISIALIRTPLTANQLSVTLVAVGFYAGWLFSLGTYWTGVFAAFLSLAASILDGCDGEIARLKYQESALGCWIETIGDYSYYIAIFLGLTIGAVGSTDSPIFYWIGGLALAGTIVSVGLLIYLRGRITGGRPERLNAIARQRYTQDATASWWSRLMWRLQVVATRCLMPYGIMALALVNLLPLVVVLAAIGGNVFWIATLQRLRALVSDDDETETVAA
jgi:phosphatidylglycerophosphate synthase